MRRFSLALLALSALAAPAFAEVKVGDAAPDFTLKDQDGKDVKLSSYKGKKNVLIAFYPADFSSDCANQMKCFASWYRKFTARDYEVLAISADPVESHLRFASTVGAQFRMLADVDVVAAKLYDVAAPATDHERATRSAFIVDKEGKLRWLDRNLKTTVKTLEGSDLLAAIEKVSGQVDPVAALAELPAADRDGKTVFVRFAQAMLNEDLNALDALLDPEACAKPGEAAQMQRGRRKALLDKWRTLFEKNDLKTLKFDDVIDVRASRVLTKEAATPAALTVFGADAHDVAGRLGEGEMLVIGRTSTPKIGDAQVLTREVVLRIKKNGDAWKILEVIS